MIGGGCDGTCERGKREMIRNGREGFGVWLPGGIEAWRITLGARRKRQPLRYGLGIRVARAVCEGELVLPPYMCIGIG